MNKYGFRLREMGFFDFIDDFYNSKYIRFLLSNLLKVFESIVQILYVMQHNLYSTTYGKTILGLAWQ